MAKPRVGKVRGRLKKFSSEGDTPWGGGKAENAPQITPVPGNPGGPTMGPGSGVGGGFLGGGSYGVGGGLAGRAGGASGGDHIGFLKDLHGKIGGWLGGAGGAGSSSGGGGAYGVLAGAVKAKLGKKAGG